MKKIILSIMICFSLLSAETAYVEKAMEALKDIVTGQVDKIEKTANGTSSKNKKNVKGFVLSTEVRTFSDISKNIDAEIRIKKDEIRLLIRQVALDIEMNQDNKSGTLGLDEKGNIYYSPNPELAEDLNKRKKILLEGDMQNNVSIRSASLAIKLLASVNKELIEQAGRTKERKQKEKLYMKQAIFVFEMSDIVLTLLNQLTLDGKNSIETLYNEARDKVARNLRNIVKQKNDAHILKSKGIITDIALTNELESLTHLEKANKRSLEVWQGILKKISSQEKYLKKLKLKKDLIAYKKSRAKLQIETLRDLRGVGILRDNIGEIDNLVVEIEALDLLVLDDRAVMDLLGE